MKHRSSSPMRDARPNRRSSPPSRSGRGASTRVLLGGALATAMTLLLLAAPVSGAGESLTPAAESGPAKSAAKPSPRAKSPVVMGVDGTRGKGAAARTSAPGKKTAADGGTGTPAPTETATGTGPEVQGSTSAGTTKSTRTSKAPTAPTAPTAAPAAPSVGTPAACDGSGRTTERPYDAGTVLSSQWKASAPPADRTYDLGGVVSTAFPSTQHPFNTGTSTPGERTCVVGGELRGTVDPDHSWEWFHDEANAACVKVVAIEWLQIHGTRCHGVEDGFRPQEGEPNSNRTEFRITGTYLTNVADDCLENDYILGGVLRDNLWESCFTGLSERPSADRSWTPPAGETLTLDHMLIGLRSMPHDSDKGTGPNALFKWSTSANKVVIKCSTFFVPQKSVNGTDTMAIPAGTVVDDSACPNNPSTIVWTGGGAYPAPTAGIRVTSDRGVWDRAVANWKAAHGYS